MDLQKTNIAVPVTKHQKNKTKRMCDSLSMRMADLFRDTIHNFIPEDEIPQDFIDTININLLLKNGAPVRTILPYMASVLGYSMDGTWGIKTKNGERYELNPFPEYGHLCTIRIIEQLWKIDRKC